MKQLQQIEKAFMRDDHPAFTPGDTLRVHVRIKEGEKERVQVFQGVVISRHGGGGGESFVVRKISQGIGVERIFPLHSPNIAKIEKVRSGSVRRAKLYYLRGLRGKSARIKEGMVDAGKDAKGPGTAARADELNVGGFEETTVEEMQEQKQAEQPVEETKLEKQEEKKQEAAAEATEETPAEEAKAEATGAEEPAAEKAEGEEEKKEG